MSTTSSPSWEEDFNDSSDEDDMVVEVKESVESDVDKDFADDSNNGDDNDNDDNDNDDNNNEDNDNDDNNEEEGNDDLDDNGSEYIDPKQFLLTFSESEFDRQIETSLDRDRNAERHILVDITNRIHIYNKLDEIGLRGMQLVWRI